jgi:beta-aspartyl-peptidase (threonine type)
VNSPVLAVHGGAWDIPPAERPAHAEGCRAAALAGGRILAAGGSALDAVEAAVVVMEDSGVFDAGVGSVLNAEGRVETDAGIMDGETLRLGAVMAAPRTRNPIRIARLLMEEREFHQLAGDGAVRYAEARGVPPVSPESLIHPREAERFARLVRRPIFVRDAFSGPLVPEGPRGTVGAVARDARGGFASACSTGGTPGKPPGRVGDTPLVGCGYFADSRFGAAACTGFGEAILKVQMARTACERIVPAGSPDAAALEAIGALFARAEGYGGLVIVGPYGEPAARWNTPTMAHAFWRDGEVTAACP